MKMFRTICLVLTVLVLSSCGSKHKESDDVDNLFKISSPTPTVQIEKIGLNEAQKGYVDSGNDMSLRLLRELFDDRNLICSPLSLQYAISMAANGASGETLQEILDFVGVGDLDALNAYNRILLEQLPAVDLEVALKLTDALLVNNDYPLLPSFSKTVSDNYYAAVENADFSSPELIAARLNEWARRSTEGFIDKVIDPSDISPLAAAFLMNALYFKAKWAGRNPIFLEETTRFEDFGPDGSKPIKMPMMRTEGWYRYAEFPGFRVLALPYAGHKFYMYFVLPDNGNDLSIVLESLQSLSWHHIDASLKTDAEVYVKIPKFDIESKYDLSETLQALGIKRAFSGAAEFGSMFERTDVGFCIGKVIQKARVGVSEWGTEAAAVTVVAMDATSVGPGEEEPKKVYFYADHPFLFFIGESTSGTLLFEGAFTGKK